MKTSEQVDKILPSFYQLKKKLKPMTKDSTNPFFKSKYLELPDILENLEPLLDELKLVLSQANEHRHGDEFVISRLTDSDSGQYVESEYKIGFDNDPQKQGARSTYGRRFSLKGLIGLAEIDDDGNYASGKDSKPAHKPADVPKPSAFNRAPAKPAESPKPAETPKQEEAPKLEPTPAAPRRGSFGKS